MRFAERLFIALTILATVASGRAIAAEILVRDQAQYAEAVRHARPGDTIVLANGVWHDFEILFTGDGEPHAPITLTAETKGSVIISGQSNLRLAGSHLVVSGLVFKDGYSPTNTVIAFRRTKGVVANHSRVTEVVIDAFNNPERFETDFWVMLYGRHNRFDHNHLEGKSNRGVTMAVRLDTPASRENHHRIEFNYFGPRPTLGSNGGETLRIGTSHHSLSDSLTTVENNYFERCDGEVEIISSKSGRNIFRGNVFVESRGTLTLRHGNNNLIENNFFLGNRVDHTGGIRVINAGQVVRNNYLSGLTGHRFGGALVVMNGVPDSPINRYHQVDGALIERNSLIDNDHIELAAGSDAERSAPPINSRFQSNLIVGRSNTSVIAAHDDLSGIAFKDNVVANAEMPRLPGFDVRNVELGKRADGLWVPADAALASVGVDTRLPMLERSATGVAWYPKPDSNDRFAGGRTVRIDPGEDSLTDAVALASAGDVITLTPGEYVARRTIIVDKPITIRAVEPGSAQLLFERSALFEIVEGGSLTLNGLAVSGRAAPDVAGNTVIRTSRYSMLTNYVLIIENSSITDLDVNHSFNVFTSAKHTFADRIEMNGTIVRGVTGHVLSLNKEVDDLGIYNAEYIEISASEFHDIAGTIADVYRGGTDESTFGPHFKLTNSILHNVGHGNRNKTNAALHLHGVQATHIEATRFHKSRPVRVGHTVGDPVTRMHSNEFVDSARPIITEL